MKPRYEMEPVRSRSVRRKTGGPGRPILIFTLVAILTGALIFWLIRANRSTPVTEEEPPQDPVAVENTAEKAMEHTAPKNGMTEKKTELPPHKIEELEKETGKGSEKEPDKTTEKIPENVTEQKETTEKTTTEKVVPPKGKTVPGDTREAPVDASVTLSASDQALLVELGSAAPEAVRRALAPKLSEYPLYSAPYRALARRLTEANLELFLSGRAGQVPELVKYTIQKGDTLGDIAHRNKTTLEALAFRNPRTAADPNKILFGTPLVLYRSAAWKVLVNKEARLLSLFEGDMLFAAFDTGIGREEKATPAGDFLVSFRQVNPPWRRADGTQIPGGDPANELGSRWLQLARPDAPHARTGYGIHGTPHPETVPAAISYGCLRMRNAEVEKLFLIIPAGTPVRIE